MAEPINGAVHGLATKTASTPENTAEICFFHSGLLESFFCTLPPAKPAPISKTPAKLSAIAKKSIAIRLVNIGF